MTDSFHIGDGGHRRRRLPYGQNEGDKWLVTGSVNEIQAMLDAKGDGLVLVHEMLVKDGVLQECLYVTADPELIREATEGHELYVAEQASRN